MEKESITYGDLPEEGLSLSQQTPKGILYCENCGEGPYSAVREDYPEANDEDDIYCPSCESLLDFDDSERTDNDDEDDSKEKLLDSMTAKTAAYSEIHTCPGCDGPLITKRGTKLHCFDCNQDWIPDNTRKITLAQTIPEEVGKDFGYDIKTCEKCGGVGCPSCQSTGGEAIPQSPVAANTEVNNAAIPSESPQDAVNQKSGSIDKEALNYTRDGTLITENAVTLTPNEARSIPFLSTNVEISDKFICPDCREEKWLASISSCLDCDRIKCSNCMDTFTEYAGQCLKCASAARSPYLANHLNDKIDSSDWFLEGDVLDEEE